MKKSITLAKCLALIVTLGLSSSQLINAQNSNSTTEINVKTLPTLQFNSKMNTFSANFFGADVAPSTLTSNLSEWLGTDHNHTYQYIETTTDDLGFSRSVFQHFYKGVKVADEVILIHEKNGKVTFVNGELSKDINLNIIAPLAQSEVERIVSEDLDASNITFTDHSQVIKKVLTGNKLDLHLVSQINALSLSSLKGYVYYIDNTDKKVINKLSKIYKCNDLAHNHNVEIAHPEPFIGPLLLADTSSTSTTFYKGNQPITVDSYNGSFRLKDNARNIHTLNGTGWDGNGSPTTGLTGTITEYTNTTANFTATATAPPVEVHWAMKNAYDYYVQRHNRNSYDGSGSIIRNYYNINFNRSNTGAAQTPENGANAAAVDMSGIVAMIYGNGAYNGSSAYFNPFVGLDVAGHEYSHLMVSRTANLAYQGESGALNESFADMFGTGIEYFSNVSPNWTIGEGIPKPALGFTFLRSMSNPNSGPAALGSQQPDTYNGTYWKDTTNLSDDNGGVHTNSGVGNYWFYLLSAGGSGTNDIGNAFSVQAITIQKSEKIAYRLLANYLTANSQYNDAYTLSKQAVTDLYGASGNEQLQNVKAWYAVGFGTGQLATKEVENIETQISIYPNPVQGGKFTIDAKLSDGTYEIYDLSGKLLKGKTKLAEGRTEVQLNGLPKGVYLLKVQSSEGITTKKLVVE